MANFVLVNVGDGDRVFKDMLKQGVIVRAMRGYAEAVLEDHAPQLDDQGRELLLRVLRNSARMDRLIQDLLTYTRISRREICLERVSLDDIARQATPNPLHPHHGAHPHG